MGIDAIIVLIIIAAAMVLFATELLSVDLVALLIMSALMLFGIITPAEGVAGFSNSATITVAFMFVLSAALMKTGALQMIGPLLAPVFRKSFRKGVVLMMLCVALISAFINNTPVVAVFIPVVVQIAYASGHHPSKLLIPLSFASIFGGTCTLIGTSTNILVSGIAYEHGLGEFSMFLLTPLGVVMLIIGILYMAIIGVNLLPNRKKEESLEEKFGVGDYLTEIELLGNAESIGKKIMDSPLVRELEMDIIEIIRDGNRFVLPPGDMVLRAHDTLKIRCDVEKMKALKDRVKVTMKSPIKIGDEDLHEGGTTLVELVITVDSDFEGKTLREVDFRRKFRAIPLAIRHREEVVRESIHDVVLKAGDVLLAEVKSHYISNLKAMERKRESPFIILSTAGLPDFNKKRFALVLATIFGVVLTATIGLLPIMVAAICGAAVLVLSRSLNMKEVYEAINWNIIFLLAGALSLGTAMDKSGLADHIAHFLDNQLGQWGPIVVISGLYLMTTLLTEVMSNNATAALIAPIAIATAISMGVNPIPFLVAVTFAASSSFMTPVGYQTNTMIYSAGQYRFRDFARVGAGLSLLFWLVATFLIPYLYGV